MLSFKLISRILYYTDPILPIQFGSVLIFKTNVFPINRLFAYCKATLIFISGRTSAISSAKEGRSGFIYNLVKS